MNQYLIWSNEHAAWWRSGHLGYTEIISKAGRYSREEAEQICADANRYRPEGAQPHEVAVLAPESVDALEAENQRLRGLLNVARCPNCDGSGAFPHRPTPDGDWEWQQCQWCDERAALSQPAEQPAAQEALPLMARRPDMPAWADRVVYHGATLVDYMRPDQECHGAMMVTVYRIAATDEHGLPVIPRTADMEGAKYRWKLPGGRDWLYEDEFLRQFKNYDYQRIEDYQPSAQENRS